MMSSTVKGMTVDGNENDDDAEKQKPAASPNGDALSDDADPQNSDGNALDDSDGTDEEFSLDQLSQAYAQVLKERGSADEDASAKDQVVKAGVGAKAQTEPKKPKSKPKRASKTLNEIDAADNAGCAISPESIVESILFVGSPKDVKQTSRKIAALLRDVSPKEVTAIVKKLNATYESQNAPYRIDSTNGNLRMKLADSMEHIQVRFRGGMREAKLSQQAIDVMAVVAYNQPVTRDQVDKIRARPSGNILTQLVRRQLLNVERTETKPIQRHYRTTDRFLDLFGLDEIEDLPQSHDVADIEELAD